jgi:two-component system, sensor histidine kinase and response regulator
VIMLTSRGQPGDGARCKDLGINAYLLKPVKTSELLWAIQTVLEIPIDKPASELITRHTVRESQEGLRILLAEDNVVNQRLAIRLLERDGHTVKMVSNGEEAIEAFDSESFDLILMDIQMPAMNGFEATAEIRKREQTTQTVIPIVALTANAMEGDRERCLAAGMNDYVSKPIQIEELNAVIDRVLVSHGEDR